MGQMQKRLEGENAARWASPQPPEDAVRAPAHSERRLRSALPLQYADPSLRVLLIEDDPGDAERVEECLSKLGACRVEITRSRRLEAGLRELISQAFDAVIIGLSLPDASPAQTLAHIRKTRASVAIIVLSGSENDQLRREALRSGAQEFVTKGTDAESILGHCLLGAVERHRAQRRKTELQLAAVDRLVAMGTMAASVAHELNNPLAAMIVNLEIAAKMAGAHPELEELSQLIADTREAAGRVSTIATDLRMLSCTDQERTELVDLSRVIESTLRMARHETRRRARVAVRLEADLPPVQAHESRIGQVLTNLVVNAAQAMQGSDLEQNSINISGRRRDEGCVEISVADNGMGMSERVLDRLFTPFFTSKPPSQGTGLGLAICKRIIDSYGGRLEVESELGVGSTFRVILPHVREREA